MSDADQILPDRRKYAPSRPIADETIWMATKDFIRRVWNKADQDGIFFMAGAIAFNLIIAIVPLMLAVLGITGLILQKQVSDPSKFLFDLIFHSLPPVGKAFEKFMRTEVIGPLLNSSGSFIGFGSFVLVWVSTRLVGTLRFVLREVYDVGEDRNIIKGKWFDVQMVIAASLLFAVNAWGTLTVTVVATTGSRFLGLEPTALGSQLLVSLAAALSLWVMFFLIYKFLPYRRVNWRTAFVSATFTTVIFELLRRAFAWYAIDVANYRGTYANFFNLIILVFWMYYIGVAFVLGGEVGQVYSMRRIRRRQKERLI
ncbi:MAG TPA: YihY/virulence factor BrkB family protein [Longimicrobiales bacterium]|nr:YihY/virulence factor BrkB family protein [Longimicrobiales bacterium]